LLVLTPRVARVIRTEAFRAWRSLRRFGFEASDLRQELTLHCLNHFDRYDPKRSSPATFASRTCRQRTLQLVEPVLARKRNGGAVPQSLSTPARTDADATAELACPISDDEVAIRLGRHSRPAAELANLRLDVERLVNGLPPELVSVARLLLEGEPNVEVARRLGLSRASLYRRIAQLRLIFRNAGLDSYHITREAA
jgi:RNA polymerase sigma factor (sigma-70 family)